MSERKYDETEKETFPASDAPANSGIAGPGEDKKPTSEQKPGETPASDQEVAEIKPQNW